MWISSADAKRYFFCRRVWWLFEFAKFMERQQTTINVALNYLRDLNVLQLVWIGLCHSFQRHKGDMT